MKKVLIGAVRSKGGFKDGRKNVKYDNIKLYLAEYRGFKTHGFSYNNMFEIVKEDRNGDIKTKFKVKTVKLKTVDFEEITGIPVKDFLKKFEREFMFHKVRIISEENDFGRDEVIELKISEKTCFELYRELESKKKLEVEDFDEDEDDEDDELDDLEDEEDEEEDDLDEPEELYDFEIDRSTGEVTEPSEKKKSGKKVKD